MARVRFRLPLVVTALVVGAAVASSGQSAAPGPAWLDAYREPASRLIGAALVDTAAWTRLAELTDTFGHRLAGSKALEDTIDWAIGEMSRDGLENVRGEKVMVPHWVRGRERAELVSPARHPLVMLGLGNSVGTPPEGIEAEAVVVRSFEELDARGASLKGKIVVYNVPWTGYGPTVQYRSSVRAGLPPMGPWACCCARSASRGFARRTPVPSPTRPTSPGFRPPRSRTRTRTGSSGCRTAGSDWCATGDGSPYAARRRVGQRRRQDCRARTPRRSGRPRMPPRLLGRRHRRDRRRWRVHRIVGSHQADEEAGASARRTVRAVLYTNEENGLRGGLAYRDQHVADLANHVLMIETDGGVFSAPRLRFLRQRLGPGHSSVTLVNSDIRRSRCIQLTTESASYSLFDKNIT